MRCDGLSKITLRNLNPAGLGRAGQYGAGRQQAERQLSMRIVVEM